MSVSLLNRGAFAARPRHAPPAVAVPHSLADFSWRENAGADAVAVIRAVPSLWTALVLVVALVAVQPGCRIQLISAYDPRMDAAASELQAKLEGFLLEMQALSESDEPDDARRRTFAAQRAFYREIDVAVSSMLLRARATPQNQLSIEQIELLRQSIESMKQLHREAGERGLREAVATPLREGLNSHLGAIIQLELAKKRGEEGW